jgi:predicted N-acetyltransferase YhbS
VRAAGEVVGGVLLQRGAGKGSGPPFLAWLSVRAAWRRAGVAGALLGAVVEWLRVAGYEQVHSAVSGANLPSLRWHWRHGFTPLPDPYTLPATATRRRSS